MSDDYPGAIYVPAHPNNIRPGTNDPRVLVWHTPEEEADAIEVTPYYFQRNLLLLDPPRRASTTIYISGGVGTLGDGQVYQCVRDSECAIANGVTTQAYLDSIGKGWLEGKEYPEGTDPSFSLNCQSLSCELEGFARTIHLTMPRGGKQWNSAVEWCESRSAKYDIPLTVERCGVRHADVSALRTDPGRLAVTAAQEISQ